MTTFFPKRIYYGWWIVLAAVLAQFLAMSAGRVIIGVFLEPIVTELGWDVTRFTIATSLALSASAISSIFIGPIVDTQGPRWLILSGAFVSAACFWLLGNTHSFGVFILLNAVGGLIGWSLFSPLVMNVTLNKWFIAKRSWALAIGSFGISLGGLVTPLLMTTIVDTYGWRDGYRFVALALLVILIPVALITKKSPDDPPDMAGDRTNNNAPSQPRLEKEPEFTRSQALHTKAFWLLLFGFTLNEMALTSVLVHAIPYVVEIGFTRTLAATGLTINGFGNFSSKFFWGWALQRIQPRRLVAAAFSCSATGVLLILLTGIGILVQPESLLLGFFLYGFGFGGTIPLSEFTWSKYFGRRYLGAIRGVGFPISAILSSLGPVLVGFGFDQLGSYAIPFTAIIATYLSGAVLVVFSQEPKLSK